MAQQNLTARQDSKATGADAPLASESVKASSGLDAAAKDVGPETVAPYGTRSRNRTGNTRPNYAEDKDIDMDNYDYYREKSNLDSSKKSARHSNAATANADGPPRGGGGSRKPLVDDGRAAGVVQNGQKAALSSTSDGSSFGRESGSGSGNSSRCSSSNNNNNNNNSSSTAAAAAAASAVAGGGGSGGSGAKGASQAAQAPQPLRKRKAAAAVAAKRPGNAAQPTGPAIRETNMMTFEQSKSYPEHGQMKADDGTLLAPNDHVYLVCEPPGEPYYLGRIMEFLPPQTSGPRPVEAVRINWFYRPKDIGRKAVDTRQVFATMHSDVSPLTALRGKCRIIHRGEIDNIDQFRKTPDSFWFEKLYDRYIQKNYDLLPTSSIVNVPDKVKKVLDERWKYVLVEQGRGKELISAAKLCKRCTNYCASNDSVDCAVCHNTYHMNCVRPPLLKKPSCGFAWSCAACSRAQERKLEARNTPNGADASGDIDEDEFFDDEDAQGMGTDRTTPAELPAPHQGSPEQVYQASLWPWRYLGMHCKPEDALDYDDRIYPRASTRIGPRHQANVTPWPGQPVQYVKPAETKKGSKGQKVSKEAQDAEKALRGKRPKWIQDQPAGYLARGEDYDENDARATSTLLWKPPSNGLGRGQNSDEYVNKAQSMAKKLGLPELSTNLRDVALETLLRYGYDTAKALKALPETEREVFKEPEPTAAEQKKFEEAVSKFGSELHMVKKHVKTLSPGDIVRYYYKWKKTERGSKVWGSYSGRKGKKQAKRAEAVASKFADDVADNDDDSAFDTTKAAEKKRSFICMFCSTTSSRQWRRAPNAAPGVVNDPANKSKDKGGQYLIALCRRCAELWRRYGIRFEEMEEVAKKVAQSGGRAWRRKQDEELLKELQAAQEMGLITPDRDATPTSGVVVGIVQEPPRKKLKGAPSDNREAEMACSDGGGATSLAVAKKDKPVDSTPVPEMPKPRTLPCAVCDQMEPQGDQHVSCRECRLTVHRNCYGIMDNRIQGKWICDMCSNDKSPQVSTHYKCVLCPVEYTEKDFVEQPRLTHHKKKMSDKDRGREKLEVQQARKVTEYYRKRQEEMNRPVNPREPLKRTTDNNWVHVTCAVWTPEVKFGNAKALEPSEGIPSIAKSRYDESCQACKQQGGACIFCHQCRVPYHIECARQQGHLLGFDVTPVKSSRRDQFNTVTLNGESGIMLAVVWCKDHLPTKTIAHRPHDVVSKSGLNALQLYVQNYKQADLALTGTVRKANLMINAAKVPGAPALANGTRRTSTTTTTMTTTTTTTMTTTTPAVAANGATSLARSSEAGEPVCNASQAGEKVCISCGIDVTPKWWPIDDSLERRLTNGHHGAIGSEAQKFVEQRKFQCHSCRKSARRPRRVSPRPSPPAGDHGLLQNAGSNGQVTGVSSLRSPQPGPSEYRPMRSEIHALLHHPASHASPPSSQQQQQQQPPPQLVHANPPAHPGPIAAPASGPPPPPPPPPAPTVAPPHAAGHTMAPRPAAVSHPYAVVPPPRQGPFNDWSHQAVHHAVPRHGSPPGHLNGGPPPMLGGMSSLSSLRPPAMSGPPPTMTPLPAGHHHAHGSPLYGNSMPTSPRRLGGPAPLAPYVPPYHGGPAHGPPGPHSASPSLSNGVPPPRTDGLSHSLHPQRSPYSGPHGSPLMSRSGQLPPHEPASSLGPRAPESRPASGASASPSLRNLLS